MLSVKNLSVAAGDKNIINSLNLEIGAGEVHAIMGPNGSGKSTLANVLMGNPKYSVLGGEIVFEKENIIGLPADKRARQGLFLAFQYPKEIPGVSLTSFLRSAYNNIRQANNDEPVSLVEFRKIVRGHLRHLSLDAKFLNRELNVGFSGGEKKKAEILQLAVLRPKLAILDETDSGLDVDALKVVAEGVNSLIDRHRSMILITHYQRILHYVKPDFVHVMVNGKIVESGGRELAERVEKEGYEWIREKHNMPQNGLKSVPLAS